MKKGKKINIDMKMPYVICYDKDGFKGFFINKTITELQKSFKRLNIEKIFVVENSLRQNIKYICSPDGTIKQEVDLNKNGIKN
jgi:hypothetical protein